MKNNKTRSLKSISHKLSALLRHGAFDAKLEMDAAGWASVDDVCELVHCSKNQILEVIDDNNKQRFALAGSKKDRIRAVQGHSTEGTPVTAAALEASWEPVTSLKWIFHGTKLDVIEAISKEGLQPIARTHVHLAETLNAKVGKRANVEIMLPVRVADLVTAGESLFRAQNGVLLTRAVPSACLKFLLPISKAARQKCSTPEFRTRLEELGFRICFDEAELD